jgi:two-component system chemotaxis sensor kinase CheA
MTLDLSQFRGVFFEECFESLDAMEAALLKLNTGTVDAEGINTIFRGAHSIKGGSATFGFAAITAFTHKVESLLDEVRGGHLQVTSELLDILLKCVDVMRAMVRTEQAEQPPDDTAALALCKELEKAAAGGRDSKSPDLRKPGPSTPPAPAVVAAKSPPPRAASSPDTPRWQIDFKPHRGALARGIDPLQMFRELQEIGPLQVEVDVTKLPAVADLDTEDCYLSWTLQLEADIPEAAIRLIFEWAEGDCDMNVRSLAPRAEASPSAPEAAPTGSAVSDVAPVSAAPAAATTAPGSPATTGPAATTTASGSPATAAPAATTASPGTAAAPAAKADAHSADAGSIRVSVEKIDELMNTVGELVITQAMLSQLANDLMGPSADRLRVGLTQLERNMRELQESVMRVRMLPISFVFSRFPRMVRDLAQRLDKQIELKLTGEQTELDKTVLEKIGDPLVHLIRNSIDHGIEKPEVRVAAGKAAAGTVHLDASHKGGSISISVSDDGGGLDKDRILAKARERNLVGANDVLTEEQVFDLIFMPGFSTADVTTDVSGRGVGMDVVRRNVKSLGGSIDVRSTRGKGSNFVITLPLTLAIVDGQTVSVGSETYIVPLVSIVESMQLKPDMVNRLAANGEVFRFRDQYLPIVRLHEVFGIEPRARALHEGLVMVVEGDGRRVGLFVDDLLGQQQVVIKSLDTNYGRIPGVSGATILGDGAVSLILDLPGLIRSASLGLAA